MTLSIEKTSIIGRFNLVDLGIPSHDSSHYIRQLSLVEVQSLALSIIFALSKGD